MTVRERLQAGWQLGRLGQAEQGLEQAKDILVRLRLEGDEWALADCMLQIAWFNLQLGHSAVGLDMAEGAKQLFLTCGDRLNHAKATYIHAALLLDFGLADEAYSVIQIGVSLAEATKNSTTIACALNVKGAALLLSRQFDLGEQVLRKARLHAQATGDVLIMEYVENNIGLACVLRGDALKAEGPSDEVLKLYRQGIAVFQQAAVWARECGDHWNLRVILANCAEASMLVGDVDGAFQCLSEYENLPGTGGPRSEIHYLYTRGEVLLHIGRLDEALGLCEAALALAESSGLHDHKVNTLRRLSEVHERLGNFEQAISFFKQFHEAYEHQMGAMTQRRAQMNEMRSENQRLRSIAEQFEQLATHDELTGLPNRRSMEAAFGQLDGTDFCLAIMDLDYFKRVNDDFSHGVGDDVLRYTGELLAARSQWLQAFRLGGEEFALLFDHSDLDHATECCERIRSDLEKLPWSDLAKGLHVTTSIGLAVGAGAEQVMPAADRLLYRAKAQGRNRVVSDRPERPTRTAGM
ncbi:tetratricopeptide repeat-containing diguanylate cyclase [Devosia sp. 2618]|uniref:tetratricopeptide repeat-containing diguanylate cyclase n=1 Tax=Devosia sp. 2618 TaxID=3156454 RepID=UPI00339A1237